MGLVNLPACLVIVFLLSQKLAWSQEVSPQPMETAMDIIRQVYGECLQDGSFHCIRTRLTSFLKKSLSQDKIRITRDLSIIPREGEIPIISLRQDQDPDVSSNTRMLERIENFIASHDLRMRLPRELFSNDVINYVPNFLLKNIPEEIRLPLAPSASVGEGRGRGFIRKVLIPFLLGLKFKATALLPLALALIALKTWKALTLGLLSMVLSGAMIIFKFSKPKLNYEVIHYAHHPHPVVEHAHTLEHYHGHGRSLPYRAYEPKEQ